MQDDGNVIPYIGTENPVIQLSQIGVQAVWNNATAAKSIRLSGGFATVNINAAGGDSTTTSQGNGGNITITGSFNVGDIVSYCGQGNDPSACGGEVLLVGCDATAGFFSATASGQGVNGNIYLVHTPYDAGCVYGNVIAMESADIQNIPMNPKITL